MVSNRAARAERENPAKAAAERPPTNLRRFNIRRSYREGELASMIRDEPTKLSNKARGIGAISSQ
jgi:hypothetical protein